MKVIRSLLFFIFLLLQTGLINGQPNYSPQTPLDKYAHLLVNYSLNLQPDETVIIFTDQVAHELNLAVYREALRAGAHPFIYNGHSDLGEIFYNYANDKQLEYINPIDSIMYEYFDAYLYIDATTNTKFLSGVNPEQLSKSMKAFSHLTKIYSERLSQNDLKQCRTVFPTDALAQEAEMGSIEYKEFVFKSCKLDEPNPAASWKALSEKQETLIKKLVGKDQVILKGPDIDLAFSIKDRVFINADGKRNFPDGEIFCSPVENSANGWAKFSYPGIRMGREVKDVELWFENGKVIKEKASQGQDFLTEMLNLDDGARVLGEFGIGTNYSINRFTKKMLYDEKMGGTIHLAVGRGFPESGGTNESTTHWDMLCNMSEGEIIIDGETIYKNGKFIE